VIVCGVFLACYLFDATQPVLAELVRGSQFHRQRTELNAALRQSSVVLGILAVITVAASASVSVTSEREGDTWASLASTLLTPSEIISGKQSGALWSARLIGGTLALIWLVGLLLGAINIWGCLAAAAITVFSALFVTALGVFASLCARNSTRALLGTFVVVFIAGWIWPNLLWQSLMSRDDLARLTTMQGPSPTFAAHPALEGVLHFAIPAVLYGAAAGVLTIWSVRRLGARWGEL
jgi:hypothetical protein